MREEYLDRFRPGFGADGFVRVLNGGARYTNCNYPYAGTETGPGHATIGSGRLPKHHGIVLNQWFGARMPKGAGGDEALIYCVDDLDRASRLVTIAGVHKDAIAPTHKNFRGENLTDRVKASIPGSRVASISQKDRSAILMGGGSADVALWFAADPASKEKKEITIASSDHYYENSPPAWVRKYWDGALDKVKKTAEWTPAAEALYKNSAICTDDAAQPAAWEKSFDGKTSFPHSLRKNGAVNWDAVAASPLGIEMITDLAIQTIDGEGLGRDEATDILWVSYSTTDWVGHYFGPDSQEVFDIFIHADRAVAALLRALDARIPDGNYLFAVTSDHGVCAVPERKPPVDDSGRFVMSSAGARAHIEAALFAKLGKPAAGGDRWIARVLDADWYLNERALEAAKIDINKAASELRDILKKTEPVLAAYTRADLEAPAEGAPDWPASAAANSHDPERSGDVFVVLRPNWLTLGADIKYSTTHGTPHGYDTHVPMLLFGAGARARGAVGAPVTPLDLAPTLAAILQIAPPRGCDGKPLPACVPK